MQPVPEVRDVSSPQVRSQRAVARPTPQDIAAEWRRRARRDGLARVMRASQPATLATGVTDMTRRIVADYLDTVAQRLSRPVSSALEVGCGIGRITPTIAAHAGRVVAIDMTAEMLRVAMRTGADLDNVEFRRCQAQQLPWGTFHVDVAVCVWVLMHVLDDEEIAAVCQGLSRSARHLLLVEYDHADIPVGAYSRLRSLDDYLEHLPGARVVEQRGLCYGDDHSFAALIALDQESSR